MYTKLLAAAIILAAGIALASLFPRDDRGEPARDTAPVGVALRRASGEAPSEPAKASLPTNATSPLAQQLAAWPQSRASAREEPAAALREPPPMPAEYAALAGDNAGRSEHHRSPPKQSPNVNAAGRPPRKIVHEVVDGDTLARLAARYLGDPALGHRIREANGGAVSDPLPIGAELEIPPRSQVATSPLPAFPGAQTRLVPVAPAQVMADADRQ